jgi:RNA polymerase sigma-70 factor (ECF subfamily)
LGVGRGGRSSSRFRLVARVVRSTLPASRFFDVGADIGVVDRSTPPFAAVLAAARAGEAWAATALYDELKGAVTGFVCLSGVPDADDVVSEVFLQLFSALPSFVGDAADLRAFAFTIARRRVLDVWRSGVRRPRTTPLDSGLDVAGGDAEQEAMAELVGHDTMALLDVLTDSQREIVLLRIVADLSIAETARVTGRTATSVKVLQHRALSALRRTVGPAAVTPAGTSTISELR